jgi:hypothetical protein
MLLVVFGAGASYDSVDLSLAPDMQRSINMRGLFPPPLANQLFSERPEFIAAMNRHPQISMLIPRLRQAAEKGGATIEEVLRDIQEEAETYPRRKSHLMALEFYLSEILDQPVTSWFMSAGGATNYAGLLDQIKYSIGDSPIMFVSFNYDRMLEWAFRDVLMYEFTDNLDSYLTDTFSLIKPHGSVDWVQQVPPSATGRIKIRQTLEETAVAAAPQLDFAGADVTFKHNLNRPWHPAIAIPLDRGKTFVCPQMHLQRMLADLPYVTHILVVGWRATELHFLAKLEERLPKSRPLEICIVDKGNGADTADQNLEKALSSSIAFKSVDLHKDGFSAFVRERKIQAWLSPIPRV